MGQKDPLNRDIRWVRFWYHDDRTPETFYEDEFGWGIPNFKLVKNNDENVVNNNDKEVFDWWFCDEI